MPSREEIERLIDDIETLINAEAHVENGYRMLRINTEESEAYLQGSAKSLKYAIQRLKELL